MWIPRDRMPRPLRVTEWSAIPAETASYYSYVRTPHASVAHPVGGGPVEVGAVVSSAMAGVPPQEPVAEVQEAKAEPAQQAPNPGATLTSVALSGAQAPQEFIPEDPKGPVERPESLRIPEIGAGVFSVAKWDELAPEQKQPVPKTSPHSHPLPELQTKGMSKEQQREHARHRIKIDHGLPYNVHQPARVDTRR